MAADHPAGIQDLSEPPLPLAMVYDAPSPEVRLPYKVAEFQETPNPNAVKCILDPPAPELPGGGMRSYQSKEAGAQDPLAAPVLGISGVVGVFISRGWVTVTRAPGTEWKQIKAAVRKVLADAP